MTILAVWSAALYAVANRRSADKPASAASVRSRSIRARRPFNSCLLVVCSCTLRCASSCFQLILRSLNHNQLFVQNRQKEMVFVLNFLFKFLVRVSRYVYFALKALLESLEHWYQISC